MNYTFLPGRYETIADLLTTKRSLELYNETDNVIRIDFNYVLHINEMTALGSRYNQKLEEIIWKKKIKIKKSKTYLIFWG